MILNLLASTQLYAVDLEDECEQDGKFKDLMAVSDKTKTDPSFTFNWNVDEFTLKGTVEFPKSVSVNDAFLNHFLSEKAVKSITHSAAGVKTLNQNFGGAKELSTLPEVGKVVTFKVTGEKCKYFVCKSALMESSCKFTEKSEARTVLDCKGIPNDNLKSHSSKITCTGGSGAGTKCSFELKGRPGSRKYALGGSAESLYSYYGLAHRAKHGSFTEANFEKTQPVKDINTFYQNMIVKSEKSSYRSP